MLEDNEFQQRIKKIDVLVRKIESLSDANAKQSALELFQLIMDLHGAGLERMMSIAFDAGEEGRRIIDKYGSDDLVSSLLLLYGLHPLDLEARVMTALEKVRPMLRSHGGSVELLGIADGAVRLRLEQSGGGCGSSARAMRTAIEEAMYDAAPDMNGLQIEETERPSASGLVQLKMAGAKDGLPRPVGGRSDGEKVASPQ